MSNRWVRGVLTAFLLSLGASALLAQGTTGKVEGTVLDATGAGLAGAQVLILGTSYGTVTDSKGYYFFNNVPAGTYTFRAQYIGMQPAEVQNVRALAGQTMTVKFTLSAAVQIGGIQVVVEQDPIVPRDQVTSKPIVTGQTVSDLPVDNIRAALAAQPGVVESGRLAGLAIRGGRAGEAAVYIDGALVRSLMTGGSELDVGTNSLEEASITTGAFGAEYGDAQSGVISYVTRAGGSKLQSSLSYGTDEPFGNSLSAGYNRMEGSVGAPLFGNLTFFLGGTLEGQQSDFLGKGTENVPTYVLGGLDTTVTVPVGTRGDSTRVEIPRFVQFSGNCDPSANFGFECQGRRQPYNWNTDITGNGKLQYTYGRGSRVSATVLASQSQQRDAPGTFPNRFPGDDNMFAPQRYTGEWAASRAYIMNWTQQVLRGSDRELAFDVNLSYQTDQFLKGALSRDYELSTRDPALGIMLKPMDFLVDFDHFSDDTGPDAVTQLRTDADFEKLVSNVRRNRGTRVPYLRREDLSNNQPYRMNPYGFESNFKNQGLDFSPSIYSERRFSGRVNADFQFDRYNRFKVGADGQTGRLNRFYGNSLIEQIFMEAYSVKPKRYAAYAEDRLDLGDVIIVMGLRWDRFDTGALLPRFPGRIFTLPGVNQDSPEDSMVRVRPHSRISPRVQVSFPVTERTGFRLSYSHQVQSPDFQNILQGINNDLSFTNGNDLFASDVGFGKTIQFEFGIRHAFSQDMVLDIAAYNKDKVSDLAARQLTLFDPYEKQETRLNVMTNADFGNVRGVDLSLVRRVGNYFNGSLAYTFEVAKGTGSDPQSYLRTSARQTSSFTGDPVDPPQAILPTDENRTHNVVGTLTMNFPNDFGKGRWYGALAHNLGAFARFRFTSGLPYTRIRNQSGGQLAPFSNFGLAAIAVEPINSSQMPWYKSFDLRVTKGLQLGRFDVTLFGDFRNLFNFTNVASLFLETGDVVNDQYRDKIVNAEIGSLQNKAGGRLTTIPGATSSARPLQAIDLRPGCANYPEGAVNCVLLQRAEQRFGNGDRIYDENEYRSAFEAQYNLINGPPAQLGVPRHIRVGLELNF